MLQSMGLQRVRHNLATEQQWYIDIDIYTMEYYSAIERNEILRQDIICMNLENIM